MFNLYKSTFKVLNYNKIVTVQNTTTLKEKIIFGYQLFTGTMYQGSLSVYSDLKKLRKLKNNITYDEYEKNRISNELLKVLPFVSIMLLPGGSLLLPGYVTLFPNSIPTNYLFEQQFKNREQRKNEMQRESLKQLSKIQNIVSNSKSIYDLQQQFQQKKNVIDKQLNIQNLTSDQLVLICEYLQMEFIQGTYAFQKLINFIANAPSYIGNAYLSYKKQYQKFTYVDLFAEIRIGRPFIVEYVRKYILLQQINNHFINIHNQDIYYNGDNHNEMYQKHRGLMKKWSSQEYQQNWVNFTLQNKLSSSQKLWYSVMISNI